MKERVVGHSFKDASGLYTVASGRIAAKAMPHQVYFLPTTKLSLRDEAALGLRTLAGQRLGAFPWFGEFRFKELASRATSSAAACVGTEWA